MTGSGVPDHAHNLRSTGGAGKPVGVITRGTTGFNRLRRSDRWTIHRPEITSLLRGTSTPLAVDVGYGASFTTTVEWAQRLRTVNPNIEVVGLEIDPERVLAPRDGVRFELGGFELAGYRPHLVRAFNVLRQYDVAEVEATWGMLSQRLAPGGFIVEGTCDEIGRRAAWVLLDDAGPLSLTLSWDPWDVEMPSDVAERLPKMLIHRNVPGEKIYDLLQACDDAYERAAGWDTYGPRVRWEKALELLDGEIPLERQRHRSRDNLLTIAWEHVAP